jgi:glycosyltransferase involved in cell wall biosynthesis
MKQYEYPISVILPVYNGEKTIAPAVESILNQSFRDFELIIINDGSTDGTPQILSGFTDPRIRTLHQENQGLVASLNRGILESRGKYIARMDADDISLPDRFRKQWDFMEQHPTVAVVGGSTQVVYRDGKTSVRRYPKDTAAIKKNIARICPMPHPLVMIRREVFDRVGLYDSTKVGANLLEDHDLWVRILAAGYDMANLPEVMMINFREQDSIMRKKPLAHLLKQRVGGRIEIITRLKLSYWEFLSIIPVVVLTCLTYYNLIKVDSILNRISKGFRIKEA